MVNLPRADCIISRSSPELVEFRPADHRVVSPPDGIELNPTLQSAIGLQTSKSSSCDVLWSETIHDLAVRPVVHLRDQGRSHLSITSTISYSWDPSFIPRKLIVFASALDGHWTLESPGGRSLYFSFLSHADQLGRSGDFTTSRWVA